MIQLFTLYILSIEMSPNDFWFKFFISALVGFIITYSVIHYLKNKSEERAKKLFDETLIPYCENAQTQQELLIAWKILHAQCLNAMTRFTIPKSYIPKFFELKALLESKLDNL
jgi:hypothetical protein